MNCTIDTMVRIRSRILNTSASLDRRRAVLSFPLAIGAESLHDMKRAPFGALGSD
jgi:hypothetical protein